MILFQKFHTVRIHIKNYAELSAVNNYPEKNDPTLSKQLKNILIKFSIPKMFRSVKIILKVVNIKLSIGEFPIHNIHTTQHNFSKEKFKGKFCFKEKWLVIG